MKIGASADLDTVQTTNLMRGLSKGSSRRGRLGPARGSWACLCEVASRWLGPSVTRKITWLAGHGLAPGDFLL